MLTSKILLLEDAAAIADPLLCSLQAEGFQVHRVQLVPQALAGSFGYKLFVHFVTDDVTGGRLDAVGR